MDKFPIFYTLGCPKCKVLQMKLNKAGLGYVICDDLNEMAKVGIKSVPMLFADDKLMDFNEALEWINEHKKQE